MAYTDYEKAQKMGLKAFKAAVAKGENEYLPVLDEILEDVEIVGEQLLGLEQIPLEKVIGTSNVGRTYAFANNFMPILDYKTEFGSKWSALCDSQQEEGIRDAIKVYEYMNYYYVVEGNKRVSVMKYFDAVNILAQVTRKIPKKTDDPQNRIYYEYMDFHHLTGINYLWFSQPGCFDRLLELTCEDKTQPWTPEQQSDFGSANHRFCVALRAAGGDKLPLLFSDALLIFIDIHGYQNVKEMTEAQMKEKIKMLWDEFLIESEGRKIELRMEPTKKGRKKIMEYFWTPTSKKVMVAFVYDKDPNSSEWLYGHELGRLYLEEHHGDKIKTLKVHNIGSEEEAVQTMEDLIGMGVSILFTTSPQLISASLKVAADHPDVTIMNSSLNTGHKLISTYYARLYEVKFLAGIVAGALSENGKIGYMADYPIIGMPANINAFALGARMVNPRAKVYLEWTKVKGQTREGVLKKFRDLQISYISDQVMVSPKSNHRQYGLYTYEGEEVLNLAFPLYEWGKFYERLIESVVSGTHQQDDAKKDVALNYWWGLSAEVVDLICSKHVPEGTRFLVDTMKDLIRKKQLSPFQGMVRSQDGEIKSEEGQDMLPEEIMNMNWLVDSIVGDIPKVEAMIDEAKSIVEQKGVDVQNED
ncbi:MAG: BMP family ABC transporter substrate-binding protein [Wujia sp.]